MQRESEVTMRMAKSMMWLAGLGLGGLLALSSLGQNLTRDKLGHFAVPRTATPPTVDGTLGSEEWGGALAVSGLASQNPGGNLLIMRPTTFYLMWDADNLYLACRTWIMPGFKPRVSGRAHNTATAHDDGMEFNLMPMGRHVSVAGSDSSYKFFINALGTLGDMGRVSVGQIFRTWQPRFEIAVRQTEPGSAPLGGSWWEAEVVFPGRTFGVEGPNVAGDVWKMLLAFNHIPGFFQAAIPLDSGYFDAGGFPKFVLTDDAPAVQVTMDELPGVKDGTAAVRVAVHNPTKNPVTVQVEARFDRWMDAKTAEPILERQKTLTVAPGATETFRINEPLPMDQLGERTGGLWYHVTQGDRELYRYYSFFKPGYEKRWVEYTPPQEAFPLEVGFNPVRNNLRLRGDSYYLADPSAAKTLHYEIRRDGEGKPIANGTLTNVTHYYFEDLMQLPALKEGEYTLTARMELADGTQLGPEAGKFLKLDEAKAFPDWWNTKLGHTERVIPPYTAVRRGRDGRFELLGREYAVNRLGLPTAVRAYGNDVLAGEARLVVVANGAEHMVRLSGTPRFTEKRDWRHRFQGTASAEGLAFSVEGVLEQDGLVTLTFQYKPEGKAPVAIDALRVEFPVRADVAENLVCIGAGGNYASHSTLVLPRDRQGRLWSTLDTGRGGSFMHIGSFYPQVWLGNEQRGLLWWADSDEGWLPVDEVPAHEVIRQGDAMVLRNNIVGSPAVIEGPRTLTFSYIATPFKPLPKGWRMAIYSENGTFSTPDFKVRGGVNGWNWLNPPSYKPEEWSGMWAEFKEKADKDVREKRHFDPAHVRNHQGSRYTHTSIPMYGYGPQTSDGRVTSYFASEWGRGNYNPTMQDYLLWLAHRAFGEGGLKTIYWDIFYTGVFDELQAGYGYALPDGRIQPTFHGYNLRRFMMRLYALMHDHGLTPGANVTHSSNSFPLIAFSWIDALLEGEFVFFRDSTEGDFHDFYGVERMRPMRTSANWGVTISWMLLNYRTDEGRRWQLHRTYTDWQRMHDTWRGQDNRVPPQTILEWGLNDADMEFRPYWRANGVASAATNLLSSVWRQPGRAIVMVFSTAEKGSAPREVNVKLDLAALGLTPRQAWDGGIVVKEIGATIGGGMPHNIPRDPPVTFDPATTTVGITGLAPRTARYIGIRVQEQADVERVRAGFAAIGQADALSEPMLDWGVVGPDTRFVPAGSDRLVRAAQEGVAVSQWRRGDRVLLAVANTGDKAASNVTLDVDLNALGLAPERVWQEFIRVEPFHGAQAQLDFHAGKLTVGAIPPGEVRWIGLRRY